MKPFKEMVESKKFWATVASILATLAVEFIPALQGHEDSLIYIIGAIGAYVVGQGIADSKI